jgi:phosphopantetheinyl transferase
VLKEALGKALGAGLRLRFERITVHLEGRPDAPAIRFDAPREHEPLLPAGIGAMLGRVGALCVASVAIRPAAPP